MDFSFHIDPALARALLPYLMGGGGLWTVLLLLRRLWPAPWKRRRKAQPSRKLAAHRRALLAPPLRVETVPAALETHQRD
jgi:hypothetical protein